MKKMIFLITILILISNVLGNTVEQEDTTDITGENKAGTRFLNMSATTFKAGMMITNPGMFLTFASVPIFAYREYQNYGKSIISSDPDRAKEYIEFPSRIFITAAASSVLGVGIMCDLIGIGMFIASAIFDKKARKLFGGKYPQDLSANNKILPAHIRIKNTGIMCLINGNVGLLIGLATIIGNQIVIWYSKTFSIPRIIESIKENHRRNWNNFDLNGNYDDTAETDEINALLNTYYGENEALIAGTILIAAGVVIDIAGIIMMSASYLVKQKADLKNKYTLRPMIGVSDKHVSLGCSILL